MVIHFRHAPVQVFEARDIAFLDLKKGKARPDEHHAN
jgi:hypothetical protein